MSDITDSKRVFCKHLHDSKDKDLKITVASDFHFSSFDSRNKLTAHNKLSEEYFHVQRFGAMIAESEAIIDEFFERAKKDDSDYLFICGDIVNDGYYEEHLIAAQKIRDFQEQSGKTVFLINGNHDLFHCTKEDFKKAYYDFGFDKALTCDDKTLSYTADLKGDYRLIAVDSAQTDMAGDNIDERLMNWIERQALSARLDCKKPIVMIHHNLIEHFGTQHIVLDWTLIRRELELPERFSRWGLKYVFTGHSHDNDIAMHRGKNGQTVYEIITCSLTSYPATYRTAVFSDKEVEIKTFAIDKINTEKLPEGYFENVRSLIENDFPAYSEKSIRIGMEWLLKGYLDKDALKESIADLALQKALVKLAGGLLEAFEMPLYEADANTDENSLEAVVKSFKRDLPKSGNKRFMDVFLDMVVLHFRGDEDIHGYEAQNQIFIRGLAGAIKYALSDLDNDDIFAISSLVEAKLKKKGISKTAVFKILKRLVSANGIELFIMNILYPAVESATLDKAPSDYNEILPGYGEKRSIQNEVVSFAKKQQEKLLTVSKALLFTLGIEP